MSSSTVDKLALMSLRKLKRLLFSLSPSVVALSLVDAAVPCCTGCLLHWLLVVVVDVDVDIVNLAC